MSTENSEIRMWGRRRSLMPTKAEWDEAWNIMTHHAAEIDFLAERGVDRAREFLGEDQFRHLVESMAVFCLTSLAFGKGRLSVQRGPETP